MELDVHIKREGEESWGFRLIGGKDFKMPLTVVKVEPSSPAARAGLQNGDVVSTFNGADAAEMSHDSAKQYVADATDTLELGVKRGLYDPVLDDYEPIYETIDQEDFDQPSQPTEVDPFSIQQFQDPKQLQLSRETSELKDIEPGLNLTNGFTNGDLSRSLTASPFLLPTKPYRPFSTEPLPEIPPLEDPIILNPNYKDPFGKLDDPDDEFRGLPETRFKLPISEQYDPDGMKKKRQRSASVVKGVKFASESLKTGVKESKFSEELKIKSALEEKMYMEKMKKEIDLDTIEMTAAGLVDESIERAVSVADEIKKEIDVELHESTGNVEIKKSNKTSLGISSVKASSETSMERSSVAVQESTKSVKASKEKSELVSLIDKTTEDIISYNGHKAEVSVSEEVEKFETIDQKEKIVDERKLSTKQEIEEVIEAGSVRRRSEAFDKKLDEKTTEVKKIKTVEQAKIKESKSAETKVDKAKTIDQAKVTDAKEARKESVKAETISESARKISDVKKEVVSSQKSETKSSDAKTNTARRVAEQKAYTIGLKTIPNIKGTIHSSHHYNLLLKTFFIHLTDVMVALSRFILTEPVFDKTEERQEVQDVLTQKSAYECREEYTSEETAVDDRTEKKIAHEVAIVKEAKEELCQSKKEEKVQVFEEVQKQEASVVADKAEIAIADRNSDTSIFERIKQYAEDIKANIEVEEIIEKQKLSGAQMAQMQERKSAELTSKMGAVISEFQNKAGIEDTEVVRQRSRSRSQIEEEVAKESDPLEWLSKVDQTKTQEISEIKTDSKSFSSTSESVEKKRVDSNERREKSSKSKEGKQMYVAIVESHCFTNKDAIFEEMASELSETCSVQSAEEINVAFQASETLATEKVSMESKEFKKELAETVIEKASELSDVNAHKEMVQMAEEITESKAIIEEVQEEKYLQVKEEEMQEVQIKEEEQIMAVSEKSEVEISEMHESLDIQEMKQEEQAAVKFEEAIVELAEEKAIEVQFKEIEAPIPVATVQLKLPKPVKVTPALEEGSAALNIVKEEIIETEQVLKLAEESELNISKHTEISATESQYSQVQKSQMESYKSEEIVQESSFTGSLAHQKQSMTLDLSKTQESSFTGSLAHQKQSMTLDLSEERKLQSERSSSSIPSTIDTPTPSTVPPTPLTDEYVFKLRIPLPKTSGLEVPRDCTPTPEDEDPNIVKKKLIPYIDTTLESPVIYDPPLPTPPADKVQSPVYTKPGLKGGSQRMFHRGFLNSRLEEILEIERTSSLLASAIDETIKSIEEYKEEVGIDKQSVKEEIKVEKNTKSIEQHTSSRKEVKIVDQPIIYNGYAKVETKVYNNVDSKIDEEWNKIDEQVKDTTEKIVQIANGLSEANININGSESETTNGVESDIVTSGDSSIKQVIKDENTHIDTEPKPVFVPERTMDKSVKNTVKLESMEMNNSYAAEAQKTEINTSFKSTSNGVQSTFSENISNGLTNSWKAATNGIEPSIQEAINGTAPKQITNGIPKAFDGLTNGVQSTPYQELTNGISMSEKSAPITGLDNGVESTPYREVTNGFLKSEEVHNPAEPKALEEVGRYSIKALEDAAKVEKPGDVSAAFIIEAKKDPMEGYKPVQFNPEELQAARKGLQSIHLSVQEPYQRAQSPGYVTSTGEPLGTHQGIVDGLEEAVVDEEVAKELGKPGMTEQKIAELISGEAEMLREAHVMGLSRVIKSHMHRASDDSSVDFKKIKPIIESLKDSEVLKALNEELIRTAEEKKREEEKKWTTFLQKPRRPVPKVKFGYAGYVEEEVKVETPYKVKIVKQPKPKVAPDYKPKDFNTGPLPWEERALNEPPPPPVEPEDPILVPEEEPEFLEAVDPLPESEVPDLEETGIPLPLPTPEKEPSPEPDDQPEEQPEVEEGEELDLEAVVEETHQIVEEMEQNRLAEQLMMGVQSMVDPNASIEQQLAQMRAQVAALAQLPGVIQQTLDLVTRQLSQLSQQDTQQITTVSEIQSNAVNGMQSETQEYEVTQNNDDSFQEESNHVQGDSNNNGEEYEKATIVEVVEETKPSLTQEEMEKLRREEEEMLEEQRRVEKQKKEMEQMRLEQESRQVKQRSTPRVGKPKPVFGPAEPQVRPLVLPGGRKWRKPADAYNEAFIAETLSAQAELIQGKAMGLSYESDKLPYDERINFMKYEKPPVSLDHLQHSDVYKLIHNMEQEPPKRVEMRTPVIAEADYREKCRSMTPCAERLTYPQQVHP